MILGELAYPALVELARVIFAELALSFLKASHDVPRDIASCGALPQNRFFPDPADTSSTDR